MRDGAGRSRKVRERASDWLSVTQLAEVGNIWLAADRPAVWHAGDFLSRRCAWSARPSHGIGARLVVVTMRRRTGRN